MRIPALKLSRVLAQGGQHHGPATLRKNLGDAYLFASNPVYRAVRKHALRAGYVYTEGDGRYAGFPLVALDRILREKRIPFLDNVTGLVELERARPRHFDLRDVESIGLRSNSLCHESTHAMCHEMLCDGDPRALERKGDTALLLIILNESLVMATEHLASAYAGDRVLGRYFFDKNFYVPSERDSVAWIRYLAREYGPQRAHALVALVLLLTWSYVARPPARSLSVLLEIAGIEPSRGAIEDARAVYRRCFLPRGDYSRTLLMDFYLRARDYDRRIGERGYLDFVDALRGNPQIVERFRSLCAHLCAPLAVPI